LPRIGRVQRCIIIALAVIGAAWMWPGLLLSAVLAILVLIPVCMVALGSDAVSGALIGLFHWHHAHSPQRAELMRARLDRLAMRVDAILDPLPESWTRGLYMADFSREALLGETCEGAPDPFDRLRDEAAQA